MDKAFMKLPRLVQIILLLIPVVNWVTEIIVRWSNFFSKGGIVRLILAIVVIFGVGIILGWVDLIWCLLFKKLFWM